MSSNNTGTYDTKEASSSTPPSSGVSYDIINEPVIYKEIEGGNLLQTDAFKNSLNEYFETLLKIKTFKVDNISKEEIDSILKSSKPKELKPGDSITTSDGKTISYEEFIKIDQDMQGVSNNDASFEGRMPKIFIFDGFHKEKTENSLKLNIAEKLISNNAAYYSSYDAMLLGSDFIKSRSKEQVIAAFSHEEGHRVPDASLGHDTVKYNYKKHAAMLGVDVDDACRNDSSGNIIVTDNCDMVLDKIMNDKPQQNIAISKKRNDISKTAEFLADGYATLAGYGKALISLLQKYPEESLVPDDINNHPNEQERIRNIERIMENPEAFKEKFEALLAKFKKPEHPIIYSATDDNTNVRAPIQAPRTETSNVNHR